MARGWESKAVESQIESAEERTYRTHTARANPEQLRLEQERESIELSRTRVCQDLASATHPKYREMLQRSLEHLDGKIAAVNDCLSRLDRHD